jgi:putative redox protein
MEVIESDGLRLWGHTARSPNRRGNEIPRRGLVLCHGFPTAPRWAESSGITYPEFADRIAAEAGWAVLAFHFRGIGRSEGDFSLGGWMNDIRAAIGHLSDQPNVDGVWLAGFRTGGTLAICVAADDERVRGVATLGAPADFDAWSSEPRRFLEIARSRGVIRTPTYPEDFAAWAQEVKTIRAVDVVDRIPPRPLLVVHGSIDTEVPLSEARVLVDAAPGAELRIITGAGHRLRHDPRGVAVLLGWLDRQSL